MLQKILLAVVAVLGLFVLLVVMQPPTFKVVRTAVVAAAPADVYAQVADFHRWDGWSPWAKLDPTMKTDYSGADGAVGASYHWVGNDKVGEGRMTLTQVEPPDRVVIKLEFIRPFASVATTTFTMKPAAAGTEVAWQMEGDNNFMSKVMCLFVGMDKMIGPDFEKGLGQLKKVAEAGGARP